MSIDEIKSCPFCGNKPSVGAYADGKYPGTLIFEICCRKCDISKNARAAGFVSYKSMQELIDRAVDKWNMRHIE